MTEFQMELQRRREQARRTFSRLATRAELEGLFNLATRFRVLGSKVGSRHTTPTPPGLADVLEKRYERLKMRALGDPTRTFYELMPLPRVTAQMKRDRSRAESKPKPEGEHTGSKGVSHQ